VGSFARTSRIQSAISLIQLRDGLHVIDYFQLGTVDKMNSPIRKQEIEQASLFFRRIYREELKWLPQVQKECALRESEHVFTTYSLRLKILKGVLLSFLTHSWYRTENTRVFIQIDLKFNAPRQVIMADGRLSNVIAGHSLQELDGLYLLFHHEKIFPKAVRRSLISLLIKWLRRDLPYLMKNIFFVREDYFGKRSMIVTISKFCPLTVIGLQHGLLRYSYLSDTKIYPNFRTRVEAVYNDQYAQYIRQIKPTGSIIYELGVPLDCEAHLISEGSESCGKTLIFISSDNLSNPNDVQVIRQLNEIACETGYDFLVRPHPTERGLINQEMLPGLKVDSESKYRFLTRDVGKVILIGFYSTLLYEAGTLGFRTVWMVSSQDSKLDSTVPEIWDLPNAQITHTSELSSEWFLDLSSQSVYPVSPNPFYPRMTRMISELFPEST
jgi:hypothetical protein